MHVAPQVTITEMTATDYFDSVAGITRSRCDELDKKISAIARSRGNAQAKADLIAFGEQEIKRYKVLHNENLAKFFEDGKVDTDEMLKNGALLQADNEEEMLERMLNFLEARAQEQRE